MSSASFLMINAVSVAANPVAVQLWYSAKSTITKYIKGQTEIHCGRSSFWLKDSLAHTLSEMRTNVSTLRLCRSLVKSALYSWSFRSL